MKDESSLRCTVAWKIWNSYIRSIFGIFITLNL